MKARRGKCLAYVMYSHGFRNKYFLYPDVDLLSVVINDACWE